MFAFARNRSGFIHLRPIVRINPLLARVAYLHAQPEVDYNVNSHSTSHSSNPYKNLFPWKNEVELAKLLVANIVYSDRGLIAISKPWGLGMHAVDRNVGDSPGSKSRAAQILNTQVEINPRYCLAEVLDYMAQLLQVRKLHIVKSAHRDWSGLVVLSPSEEVKTRVEKSVRRAIALTVPYIRFYCITNGIPSKVEDTEKCGIRLFEIDSLGDYKEPVYVAPEKISANMRKIGLKRPDMCISSSPLKPVNVHYRTLATNRELAVSLVELQTSATKWSFVQCFLAYKASFVLGDTFFSQRVKHILGQPVAIKPKKAKTLAEIRNIDYGFEPLSTKVQRALNIRRNGELPLMVHCAGLTFTGLSKSLGGLKVEQPTIQVPEMKENGTASDLVTSSGTKDIIINADQLHQMPSHFVRTLDSLNLNVFANSQE